MRSGCPRFSTPTPFTGTERGALSYRNIQKSHSYPTHSYQHTVSIGMWLAQIWANPSLTMKRMKRISSIEPATISTQDFLRDTVDTRVLRSVTGEMSLKIVSGIRMGGVGKFMPYRNGDMTPLGTVYRDFRVFPLDGGRCLVKEV